MGCDIHLYVEIKENGKWKHGQKKEDKYNEGFFDVPYEQKLFTDRNYTLFAFLANVRNYGYIKPICESKGLPLDISKDLKIISESWGEDGHSHSFFTLEELKKAFDPKKTVTCSGLMSNDQWNKFEASLISKKPDYNLMYPYCQGTTEKNFSFHTWEVPFLFKYKGFIECVINKLNSMFPNKKDDEIRIIFWFDN